MVETISKETFIGLTEQMLRFGGAWTMSLSKDGCTLLYDGKTHNITEQMADVMFKCIPRKCKDSPGPTP